MKSFIVSASAIALLATRYTLVNAMKGESDQSSLDSAGLNTDTTVPDGGYYESCTSCSMVVGSNIDTTSTLSCQCYDGSGSLQPTSYLQNAWACNGCIINENGALTCQLPVSATVNGYQSQCSGCGLNDGTLFCLTCGGVTHTYPFTLKNACSCSAVTFGNGALSCDSASAAPTSQPSAHPTTKTTTKSPTPNAAPTTCESYWLDLSATGEKAPYKPCSNGSFLNSNGCQYQNYCCWQPESSTSPQTVGVCKVPNGVPVDCPLLDRLNCLEYSTYCSWNADYGTSGLCQRKCPGNPQTMCAL